jgi:hypothetical protein
MKTLAEVLREGLFGEPGGAAPPLPRPEEPAWGRGPASASPRLAVLLQPRPLILSGLPYKPTTRREVTRTARTGAGSWLTVTYLATDDRYGLPFGADRALLAWITTKAFGDGSVRFSAVAEYFDHFGLHRSGADYRRFRERWQRVSNLALRLEETSPDERHVRRLFLVPTSREPLSLDAASTADIGRECLRYNRHGFDLDPTFWQYLRDTRVPTPLALLRRFHDQPQAWDFCQLVLFRCYSARSTSVIPWSELLEQLGARTTHPRRLRVSLTGVLDTVRGLFPDFPARFLAGSNGLEVSEWRMPMSE